MLSRVRQVFDRDELEQLGTQMAERKAEATRELTSAARFRRTPRGEGDTMATENTTTTHRNGSSSTPEDEGRSVVGVMAGGAQEAATRVRSAAETVAERLPAAMDTAHGAVNQTARQLEELPSQALIVGTSFSLGLGVGMFLTGTNRLLVLLALLPAAAMAATLAGRDVGMEGSMDAALGGNA